MRRSRRQERSGALSAPDGALLPASPARQSSIRGAGQGEWLAPLRPGLLQLRHALSIVLAGLTVFAATTSLVYVRERSRWQRREVELAGELEAARGQQERLSALLAADPQVVVSWKGRNAEPVFEGDSGLSRRAGSDAGAGLWRLGAARPRPRSSNWRPMP